MTNRPRLHVDTDCGVDDALALMTLVRGGAVIESVSAVFGNTYVDQAAANARGVLRLSGCGADLYIGAGHGLARRPVERMRAAHGVDGLNGAGFPQRWKLPVLGRGVGMSLLAYAARRRIGGLFLGPLTNLANGLLDDPAAFRGWQPVIMAGAFAVEGMAPGGADFNTWSDPDALARVLDSGVSPRLVPLDITTQVTLDRAVVSDGLSAAGQPLYTRLGRALDAYMDAHAARWGISGCHPHDAVTAAAVLWPELFTFEPARLKPVLGPAGEGQGRILRLDGTANGSVCTGLDAPEVTRRLIETLFAAPGTGQDANT